MSAKLYRGSCEVLNKKGNVIPAFRIEMNG